MKKLFCVMFLVLMFSMLVACGSTNESESENADISNAEEEVKTGFPITIVDATGVEVTIEELPERMITLVPSNTEILYALGALDRVIAVSDNDDFPAGIQDELPSIGGMEFNVEEIIGHSPDLVLASGFSDLEGIEQIRNAGIPVIAVQNASSFAEVYESIAMIGKVIGEESRAKEVINHMKVKVDEIRSIADTIKEPKSVWVEIWAPELYTTGNGTFMHEMLEMIGAVNVAGESDGWPLYTEEDAVVLNPDVIITTYGHVPGKESAVQDVLNRAAWQHVNAVINQEVYNVEANIVERPGPRLIEGVEKLANLVYPEVFKP